MALDLQITTGSAKTSLKQIEDSITALKAVLEGFGKGTAKVKNLVDTLNGFKGVDAAAASNMRSLADAIKSLKGDELNKLGLGLNKLVKLDVAKVASQVKSLVTSLARLRVPPGISKLASDLTRIESASRRAVSGLKTLNTELTKTRNKSRQLGVSLRGTGTSMISLTSIAGALGISLGAIGAVQLIKTTTRVIRSMDQFKSIMTAVTGTAKGAAEAFAFVSKTSSDLKQPILASAQGFAKFSAAVIFSGNSMKDAQKVFLNFSKVSRVLKLSGDELKRVFLALEQGFSKGRVSTEELRRQLGEVIPGAFEVFAESVGKTGLELADALKGGEIESKALIKFSEVLAGKFEKGLVTALKTFSAEMDNTLNLFQRLQIAFADGFNPAVVDSLAAFNEALKSKAASDFASGLGTLVGVLSAVILRISAVVAQVPLLSTAIAAFIGLRVAARVASWTKSILAFVFVQKTAEVATTTTKTSLLGLIATKVGGFFVTLGGLVRTAAISMAALSVSTLITFAAFAAMGIGITLLVDTIVQLVTGSSILEIAAQTLGTAWGGVLTTITAVGAALGLYKKKGDETVVTTEKVASANEILGERVRRMGEKVINVKDKLPDFAKDLDDLGTSAINTAGKSKTFVTETQNITDASGRAAGPLTLVANKMTVTATESGKAATGTGALNTELVQVQGNGISASGGLEAAAGSAITFAGNAANATTEALKLAEALREVAAARDAGGGLSGGEDRISTSSNSEGGIIGVNTVGTASTPVSAFAGAPRFAAGTANTTGGGIPAIVHPNEAIIPLSGGRTVPVELSGGPASGGTSSSSSSTEISIPQQQLDELRLINTMTGRVWEAVNTGTTLLVDQFKLARITLDNIFNRQADMIAGISSLETKFSSISSSSGGGSSSGGTNSSNQKLFGKLQLTREQVEKELAKRKKTGLAAGGGFSRDSQGRLVVRGSLADDVTAKAHQDDTDLFGFAELELVKLRERIVGDVKKRIPGFALGTPNTGSQPSSGGLIRVHSNEAIIPLPDGRSVPVSIQGGGSDAADAIQQALSKIQATSQARSAPQAESSDTDSIDRLARTMSSFLDRKTSGEVSGQQNTSNLSRRNDRQETRGSGGPVQIKVEMNINVKDAASFRESENQLVQEMRTKIEAATRTIGSKPAVDDPTVFAR